MARLDCQTLRTGGMDIEINVMMDDDDMMIDVSGRKLIQCIEHVNL